MNLARLRGEQKTRCPLEGHDDVNPSFTVNFEKGVYFCFGCRRGGQITENDPIWNELKGRKPNDFEPAGSSSSIETEPEPLPSEAMVEKCVETLQSNKRLLRYFRQRRGLNSETLRKFRIGWEGTLIEGNLTIPIYDSSGNLVNFKRVWLKGRTRPKKRLRGLRGRSENRLYPLGGMSDSKRIYVVEGELDALFLKQRGLAAVSSTGGAAGKWDETWLRLFASKDVVIIPDRDLPGEAYAQRIAEQLSSVANSCRIVDIPLEQKKSGGSDIVDWWRLKKPKKRELLEMLESSSRRKDDSVKTSSSFRLLSLSDLLAQEPPEWVIEDLLPSGAFSFLYAPPNSGKSFLAIDWGMSVASGLDWNGRKVKQSPVVYFAAEGMHGMGVRCEAWLRAHSDVSRNIGFSTVEGDLNLMNPYNVQELVDVIASLDELPGLVIIDTYASSTSGDENSSQQTLAAIRAMKSITRRFGASVLPVHHTGKALERGERGSTALRASAEAVFSLRESAGHLTLKVEKQRDARKEEPIGMRLETFGPSCILRLEQSAEFVKISKKDDLRDMAVELLRDADGLTLTDLSKGLKRNKPTLVPFLDEWVADQNCPIACKPGRRAGSTLYYLERP